MAVNYRCVCGFKGTQKLVQRHAVSCSSAADEYRAGNEPVSLQEDVKSTVDRSAVMVQNIIAGKAEHEQRLSRWAGYPDPLDD